MIKDPNGLRITTLLSKNANAVIQFIFAIRLFIFKF